MSNGCRRTVLCVPAQSIATSGLPLGDMHVQPVAATACIILSRNMQLKLLLAEDNGSQFIVVPDTGHRAACYVMMHTDNYKPTEKQTLQMSCCHEMWLDFSESKHHVLQDV